VLDFFNAFTEEVDTKCTEVASTPHFHSITSHASLVYYAHNRAQTHPSPRLER
jgi:hypothetical protein